MRCGRFAHFAQRMRGISTPSLGHLASSLWKMAEGICKPETGRQVVVLHVFATKPRMTSRRALATTREGLRHVSP